MMIKYDDAVNKVVVIRIFLTVPAASSLYDLFLPFELCFEIAISVVWDVDLPLSWTNTQRLGSSFTVIGYPAGLTTKTATL